MKCFLKLFAAVITLTLVSAGLNADDGKYKWAYQGNNHPVEGYALAYDGPLAPDGSLRIKVYRLEDGVIPLKWSNTGGQMPFKVFLNVRGSTEHRELLINGYTSDAVSLPGGPYTTDASPLGHHFIFKLLSSRDAAKRPFGRLELIWEQEPFRNAANGRLVHVHSGFFSLPGHASFTELVGYPQISTSVPFSLSRVKADIGSNLAALIANCQ